MEDQEKINKVLAENKWLMDMWNEFDKVSSEFHKKVSEIEEKYQKKYNNGKNDVFFAWLEGAIIGIDWKDINSGNKDAVLIHDADLKRS